MGDTVTDTFDCRVAYASTLEHLAERYPQLIVVTNDAVGSSKLVRFRERFPDRLVNVGIAEQNMVGIASGLANGGMLPFVSAASCFLTARGLEQIKVDLAYSRRNVKLCGMSSGVAYGALGATHHSIEDIAWTRAIAGMTVVVPADPIETAQAVEAAAELDGPVFLRISRMGVPEIHDASYRFEVGKAHELRHGTDVTIIANGTMAHHALRAAEEVSKDDIDARVLNMATVRPLDVESIARAAGETGAIVTVEEHTIHGGLGSAVAEVVVATHPVPMRILGIPGVFAPTGSATWILDHFKLNTEGIVDAVKSVLGQRVEASA